ALLDNCLYQFAPRMPEVVSSCPKFRSEDTCIQRSYSMCQTLPIHFPGSGSKTEKSPRTEMLFSPGILLRRLLIVVKKFAGRTTQYNMTVTIYLDWGWDWDHLSGRLSM